ncbi:MAG: 50S ribosomal protein L23 [Dehalococcoidia bacterium]|jgi:large subunit ribosomal protein L23|nr:50S ribosomal protein L23 [Dehalococcoidia bacterium]|tara:strand:+ start:710 stop:997 length:288 start_codon:yes stop_codon:yes gene_type:complete
MHVFQVLKRPIITEKSTVLQEQNKYVFEIMPRANKTQVREAVERAFEVSVTNVNIVMNAGENRRLRNGRWLRTSATKKAIVTVAPGQTIQLFEGA